MTATVEVTSPAELQDDDTKNDIASTKEVIEQEELVSMKVDQSMVEQNVSEEQNDETDPTCQAIQEVLRSEDSSFEHSQDEQLLSIANLLENSNHLADRIVPLVDADLSKQAPSQDRSNQQDLYLVDLPVEAEMRSSDQLEISPNNIHQFKGFSEAKPKLSFASQKMKDYFESFRGHHREKMRLYQFFKSIRTELVACLLFTLISSHALIVCRTSLYESSLDTSAAANDDAQARRAADIRIGGELRAQLGISQFGSERKAAVHLLTGLVTSLTVASLTQVFGHVSGCHLIPSISVALYVKGHISRARLFSYLFAQFVGSLIGVSLLGLLTTSQVTPDDYREILQSPNQAGFAIRANSLPLEFAINAKAVDPLREETHPGRHRNRRGADLHLEDGLINDVNFSSDPFQASETILLSIEEQQQRRQLDKRNQISREADVEPPEKEAGSGSRALPANYNDATFARIDKIAPSSTSSRPNKSGDSEMRAAELTSQSTRLSQVVALSQPKREIQPDRDEVARILKRTNKGTSNELDDSDKAIADIGFKKRLSGAYIDPESQQRGCDQSKLSDSYGASVDNHKPLKLRRKKRNRLVNNTASLPPTDTSQFDSNSEGSRFYINLLGFGLPDPIMSSESIRQCIELQSSELQQQSQLDATTMNKKRLARLAGNGFQHCLSLSNSSQMFVFQLLASLIIVLTYLVNVDPRRVDLGFKSLSIGLSYFVANALAIHSGGFFGNPFHLLCLSWFSQATTWQPEWIIYLVTPLIGGLFGALSHEYIDFTSARNCNKQLHLRRSFYSLDNLQQTTTNSAVGNQAGPSCAAGGQVTGCETHLDGVSALAEMQRQTRRAACSPNGSLESVEVTSSVLNSPTGHQDQPATTPNCRGTQIKSNANRKFESYSRQLRLEQRQAKVAHVQCAVKFGHQNGDSTNPLCNTIVGCSSMSARRERDLKRIKAAQLLSRPDGTARRSQFEPNFLISSSPTERHLVSKTSMLM